MLNVAALSSEVEYAVSRSRLSNESTLAGMPTAKKSMGLVGTTPLGKVLQVIIITTDNLLETDKHQDARQAPIIPQAMFAAVRCHRPAMEPAVKGSKKVGAAIANGSFLDGKSVFVVNEVGCRMVLGMPIANACLEVVRS